MWFCIHSVWAKVVKQLTGWLAWRPQACKTNLPKLCHLKSFFTICDIQSNCDDIQESDYTTSTKRRRVCTNSWQIALFSPLVGHFDTKALLSYTSNDRLRVKMKNGTSGTSLTLVCFTVVSDWSFYCNLPLLEVRAWLKLMKNNFM